MEKENNKQRDFALIMALIWFILLIVLLDMAYSYDIDPGECYSESIFVDYNETFNSTFSVCSDNCSVIGMNISLYPGQTKTFNQSNCYVDAHCNNENCSLTRCEVQSTVDPGDTYILENAVCDLQIECEECEDDSECDEDGIPTTYKETFKLEYDVDKQEFTFEFGDYDFTEDANTSVTITKELQYNCPIKTVNATTQILTDQCRDIIPLYCDNIVKLLIEQNGYCNEYKENVDADLLACRSRVAEYEGKKCISYANYNDNYLDCVQNKNESVNCNKELGVIEAQYDNQGNTVETLWGIIFFLIVLCVVLGYRLKKSTNTMIPKEFRGD